MNSEQPRYAFQVRPQSIEQWLPEYAHFYEGIYGVTVNHHTHIAFVPAFQRPQAWPPQMPDDVDVVTSEDEARLFTALLAHYTITPDDKRVGQRETLHFPPPAMYPEIKDPTSTLIYVTTEQFIGFQQELATLAERLPSVHDRLWLPEVADQTSIQFIIEHVLEVPAATKQ